MKTFKLTISGEKFEARVVEYTPTFAKININGTDYEIQIEDDTIVQVPKLAGQDKAVPLAPSFSSGFEPNSGEMRAPLPGVIVSIPVKEGDKVSKGQTIMILEAMKMESEIAAPVSGTIKSISVKERSPVQEGDLLMIFEGMEIKEQSAPRFTKPLARPAAPNDSVAPRDNIVRAPIPGLILDVKVREGEMVSIDQVLIVLEAMKMESDIHSTLSGRVTKIHARKGDTVQEGDPLLEVEG